MLGKTAIDKLKPLLEGDSPNDDGEWPMHCPYHGDRRRSASVNVKSEFWYCLGCGEGGEARKMIRDVENWKLPDNLQKEGASSGAPTEVITEAKIDGWAAALLSNKAALEAFRERRGLTTQTIKNYQIGYDGRVYTIPIRDMYGEIVNVRRYDINVGPDSERRKIWSVDGMGTPTLFPVDQLDNDSILICEGEWDALLAIQNGIPAVTRTGTADHWKQEWGQLFRGKRVFICHDMDEKGQAANSKVVASLRGKTLATTVVQLPYEVEKKTGLDLTDYFYHDGFTKQDFIQLVRAGRSYESIAESSREDSPSIVQVSVMDSFNAALVEVPLTMQVTVTGKRLPSYLVPSKMELTCDEDFGAKCKNCSMYGKGGLMTQEVGPESPLILGMIGVNDATLDKFLRKQWIIPTACPRLKINRLETRTVEEIYVRPSIELQSQGGVQDFTHRKVISTVSHDLTSNQTVDVVGTIRPEPNRQTNEFMAWRVERPKNTLDSFELSSEIREQLECFEDEGDPLAKGMEIADELARHVTHIYYRPDMHLFMDLVIHSGLRFNIPGKSTTKGYLDALIIGDTRTGKSEAASMLVAEYGMGEMISCESASYAGVTGGLDRTPDGQWIVRWGAIPVNDRRFLVLDEVSGLQPNEISQMSNIRTEGVIKISKIESQEAMARTRLLWLANPRESRMDDFTFGVQAIQPLVGTNEDIARFDMAMGVFSREVGVEDINRANGQNVPRKYSTEALRNLIRWAWTRDADHIFITKRSVEVGKEAAVRLGTSYIETPPLIQQQNIIEKLMRIAVAFAMRTFSCDQRGRCVVHPRHIKAAEDFLNMIYHNVHFGYGVMSGQRLQDRGDTGANMDEIMRFINERPGLVRFLKHTPVFDNRAVETVMNVDRSFANGMIAEMWKLKAVTYEDGKIKLEPDVLAKMREFQL